MHSIPMYEGSDGSGAVDLDAVLANTDWVRRLARSLVRDPASADDLAQDVWLTALTARSGPQRGVRPWLGGIARRLARRRAGGERARREREARVDARERAPGADELLAQAELQRRVIGEVTGLEEPYRRTVLLRYFEGLSVEELSRREGIPSSTGRTRLQRALAKLRERLDRAYGERSSWCALLAGGAGKGASAASVPLPAAPAIHGLTEVLVMGSKVPLLVAGSLAVGATLVWWDPLQMRRPAVGAGEPVAARAAAADREPLVPAGEGNGNEASSEAFAGARSVAPVEAEDVLLYGSLVTTAGERLAEGWIQALARDEVAAPRPATIGAPGSWSILGLTPGKWTLRIDCPGALPATEVLEVTGAPRQRHDLVLAPDAVIRVRFETPEGDLLGALPENREAYPCAVATADAPPAMLPGLTGRDVSYFGASDYHHGNVDDREVVPDGWSGVLNVRVPLPAYVSAVLRGAVIETRFVRPGTEELVFVLSADDLRARLATASVRVVDAVTGAPITAGRVELQHTQTGGGGQPIGADGAVAFEHLLPGLMELGARVSGYERARKTVRLEPGAHADLGTLALSPVLPLAGRVTDTAGTPLSVSLTCVSMRQLESPLDVETRSFSRSGVDGAFELSNAPRGRVLVRAGGGDWPLTPFVVDNPSADELVLVLRPGTNVRLEPGALGYTHPQLTLATSEGAPFWTSTPRKDWPIDVLLPPGRYQLWIGVEERVDRVRELEVGDQPLCVDLESAGSGR